MRIAVTYKDNSISSDYRKTEFFMIYNIEGETVDSKELIEASNTNYEELRNTLKYNNVDILICGDIDLEEANVIIENGINVYYGGSGNADILINAFISQGSNSGGCGCGGSSGG